MPYIPCDPVESSNLEAVGYHRQTQTLRIIFHGGRAYDYPLVPEQEYRRLMEAESKGKFFNSRIKPMYGHRTVRPEELEPPKEPCCNHPGKACSDEDCGHVCDPGCCPQQRARSAETVAGGLARGQELIERARTGAIEVPPAVPLTPEGEIDVEAIPILGFCRCCGTAIEVTPEDAVELCVACYRGKGGDTNDPCTAHPGRLDDCPHGRDGRSCTTDCACECHTGVAEPEEE